MFLHDVVADRLLVDLMVVHQLLAKLRIYLAETWGLKVKETCNATAIARPISERSQGAKPSW